MKGEGKGERMDEGDVMEGRVVGGGWWMDG